MPTKSSPLTLPLLIASWISFSVQLPAQAQAPLPSSQRARLKAGDKAPFAGVLLADAALAKIISEYERQISALKLEGDKARRELEVEKRSADAICKAEVAGERARYAACDSDAKRQGKTYQDALSKANESHWYQSPYVSFLFGNLVAGGVCAAATRIGR